VNTSEVESALIAELLEALRALPDVTADLACQGDSGVQAIVNDVSVSMRVAGRSLGTAGRDPKGALSAGCPAGTLADPGCSVAAHWRSGAEGAVPLLAAESISPGRQGPAQSGAGRLFRRRG
jgi:hypothetical protein